MNRLGYHTTLRELPIEIWDQIIDLLRYDLDALIACGQVSRTWRWRCRKHVQLEKYTGGVVTFRERNEVAQIGKMTFTKWRVRSLHIRGGEDGERKPIRHLATWATVFSGRWTGNKLTIENAEWRMRDMRPDTFLDLTTFTSITFLYLHHVTFPNIATFGRLLYALPKLAELQCSGLRWSTHGFDQATFPRRGEPKLGLRFIKLEDSTPLDGIAEFFAMSHFCVDLAVGSQQFCLIPDDSRLGTSPQCSLDNPFENRSLPLSPGTSE